MKLASLKEESRDGALIVVSDDLKMAVKVEGIIPTLQAALENWQGVHNELDQVYALLCAGEARDAFALDLKALTSPLPRAYQWLDGSAYLSHVELMRISRGLLMLPNAQTDPQMYQGASDSFIGPYDDILVADLKGGVDFEAEVAVVTDAVPMGVTVEDAAAHIKLVMLVNDVSLRYLAMSEIAKGFGFIQAKPASSFSPVAVTLDTLGEAWRDGRLHLPLVTHYNGELFGKPNAGIGMTFNFPQLIAHAARTRFLSAGTIIGSGTVSNKEGASCIVEKRTRERLETGESATPFMQYGDRVRIEMLDASGASIFGAIEQKVVEYVYER